MKVTNTLLLAIVAATVWAESPPETDGNVRAISSGDIQLIAIAAKSWLQNMHAQNPHETIVDKVALIHVVNQDKAEVNVKQDSPKWSAMTIITVRRLRGSWKADGIAKVTNLKLG